VEQERVHKRALWKSLPIALMGKLLERRGSVQRAPNIALIEVTESTAAAFVSSVPSLVADFDRIVVLWRSPAPSPALPKSFMLVQASEEFKNRWSLLHHCADGFVFPLRAGFSRSREQQRALKAQLFSHGANCVAGYANLKQHLDPAAPLAADFRGPVLVSSLEINQVVFDQRFLKIRPSELATDSETKDLATLASKRQSPLLAIDTLEVEQQENQLTGELSLDYQSKSVSRDKLIETLIRMPSLSKGLNIRTARLWSSIWRALGYPAATNVTADQVRALAVHRAASKPSLAEVEKANSTLKILGAAK
jgi:hypothetical protein